MQIATSAQSPQLQHARAVLAAICEQPRAQVLPAVEALATLEYVHPPLPPVIDLPAGARASTEAALSALEGAAQVAADPAEALRIADAALALRTPVAS